MNKLGRVVVAAAGLFAAFAGAASGCSPSSDTAGPSSTAAEGSGGTSQGGAGQGGTTGTTGSGGTSGCAPIVGYDPVAKGLPSCCDKGPSHCIPTSEVPASLAPGLATCKSKGDAAGLCLPDTIITKGSDYVAPACKSIGESAGVCLSLCIDKIGKDPNVGLLTQGPCGKGEVCVPCINPLTHESTGACELGPMCLGGPDAGAPDAGAGGAGGSAPVCPYDGPPLIDPATFDPCTPACGGAHCVPAAMVPKSQQALLGACSTKTNLAGFCTPDPAIASGGNFIPKTCTSLAKSEGRCLSSCLPSVGEKKAILARDVCAKDELCVPCTDPTTGTATGACAQSCDPGPTEPPVVLTCPYDGPALMDPKKLPACAPACGGSHCVPAALVPKAQQAVLADCPGGFCSPDNLTAGAGLAVPATCVSVAGAEGRCTSMCLPSINAQSAVLPQSTCAANERCAPCFNPAADDPKAPTGVCSVACDKPAKPPLALTCPWNGPPVIEPSQLPACSPACGNAHCVPFYNVPVEQQPSLSLCPGGYCLPDALIASAGNVIPKTCAPLDGFDAEGRCLSTCLKSVAEQASQLQKATCDDGELCVPCFDPITGKSTGACSSSSCDAPAKPAYTFPKCCSYLGASQATCLPTAKVPADQQAGLQQETCPASFLCVPDEYLPNASVPIGACTTQGQGVCVSKCVPDLPVYLGSGDCPDKNHVCVPCSFAPTTPGCK